MDKENILYYQSNIKTSRNEDSVYDMKYASQQMLIDKLEQQCKKQKEVIDRKKYLLIEQGTELKELYSEIDKLQGRIDKAIEYIDYSTKYRNGADIYQFVDIESEILEPLKFILELDEENGNAYLKEFNDWLKEVE